MYVGAVRFRLKERVWDMAVVALHRQGMATMLLGPKGVWMGLE